MWHVPQPYARPPFNNPAADLVIRSCDGVNFRVRSAIVAEASPIFSDMFELPQPQPPNHPPIDSPDFLDGKPVVAVEEDSQTLDHLLRLCYPVPDPELVSLSDVRPVLAAALKYEMEEAVTLMKKSLLSFVDQQPLAVWAVACTLKSEAEAKIAATVLLNAELPLEPPPELQMVTAAAYYRLTKFLRAGGDIQEAFDFCEPGPLDVITSKPRRHRTASISYQPRPFVDIICRCSDGKEFLTHKVILCAASPILHDRVINLPATASETLPVLDLDFRGEPFGAVLELCYPKKQVYLGDLPVSRATAMLHIAHALDMETVVQMLRFEAFGTLKVAYPLESYLLTSGAKLWDVASDALDFIYSDPLEFGYVPEMEITPADAYHRLVVNRHESLAVAQKLTNRVRRVSEAVVNAPRNGVDVEEMDVETSEEAQPQGNPWLLGILKETAESLHSPYQNSTWWEKPDTSAMLEKTIKQQVWCHPCEENVRLVLRIGKLYSDVRRAMDENNVSNMLFID